MLIKLYGKKEKNEIVCSFNGIPITCRLEVEFVFTQSEIIYVTQSSLKRLFHVANDMSSERECRCGLSQFHCRNMKSNKDTLRTNKQIVDLIIY